MATISFIVRENRDGNAPFSVAQREAIQSATDEAERIAIEGLNVLNQIWNQPGRGATRRENRRSAWRANAIVVRWFGGDKLTNKQIRKTRRLMERLRQEFQADVPFTIVQHQTGRKSYLCNEDSTGHVSAYCSLGARIKLCPRWFEHDLRTRAENIIHELGHKKGHIDHRRSEDHASALLLAVEDPKTARHNPSNFSNYCGEFF